LTFYFFYPYIPLEGYTRGRNRVDSRWSHGSGLVKVGGLYPKR